MSVQKLTNRDIRDVVKFGFCNIFNFGIIYYRINKCVFSRMCIIVSKKQCLFSVNKIHVVRFMKYVVKLNVFTLRGYDTVMIISCMCGFFSSKNNVFFL